MSDERKQVSVHLKRIIHLTGGMDCPLPWDQRFNQSRIISLFREMETAQSSFKCGTGIERASICPKKVLLNIRQR